MITEFVASWPLFAGTYLTGTAVALLLALVGVLVVARDQIFLGAAVAQATMLGIAIAIRFEHTILLSPMLAYGAGFAHTAVGGFAAVVAALIASAGGRGRDSAEALTGWVYLTGASVAVLMVANSAHGLAEVQALLATTIIGADILDATAIAAIAVASIAVFCYRTDEIILFATDAEMARAVGIGVGSWNRLLAIWLGVSLALAIHIAGTVYAFGCLVLPGLVARNLCRNVREMFLVAPLIAVVTVLAAFVVANSRDWPPGQTAVAFLSAELALSWGWRVLRDR